MRVAEVTGITPPNISRETQDATHTESPGGYREFIAGLKDGGEVTTELNLVPDSASTALLLGLFDLEGSAALTQCRIIFPDGDADASPITASVWAFSAICTGLTPEAPLAEKMAASATWKISGKPTLTQAA